MVDWNLSGQVARLAAGSEEPVDLGLNLARVCAELEQPLADYTRLEPARPLPAPELVGRAAWAEINLDSLRPLLDPVAARLDGGLERTGPLAGLLKAGAGAALGAESGLVLGYVARRVLGQYELSLLGADTPPRLLLVAPNLDRAAAQLAVDRDSFLTWVCAHELTHVFQFQGVTWLREHLGGLLRRYLETVDVEVGSGGLSLLSNPGKLVESFREGGLAALIQTREQQVLLDELQAAMAVIEGYAEHVMDVLGEQLLPAHAELRAALDRRRASRSAPERVLERLLGFDLKLRQYELGKRFCDGVVEQAGIDGLNRVWAAPLSLPTLAELDEPTLWLARTAPPAAA
ncbi:MAG TPA: zinc-dependent metalloprotease [Thermoleophilaceae bacterium]